MLAAFAVEQARVEVYADSESVGKAAAAFVSDIIRAAIVEQGAARVIFATGNSQLEFLRVLIADTNIDWTRVTAFHLDEYVALPQTHPASFRRFLREKLYDHLPFAAVHLLDGEAADTEAESARYAALLDEAPIDVACIGIGENAHLAFNDPPADFETSAWVHVVTLDEACRRQQVGEGHFPTLADVPPQALSLSIPAILAARAISCVVPDARKAPAVTCALRGPITPDCPASILRTHPNCRLFLDTASAASVLP